MKLEKRQAQMALTDRALAKKADVSTATIHRAKRGGELKRYGPMQRIAEALDVAVEDIDEFRAALFARMYRAEMARGAPDTAIEEAENLQEIFELPYPDPESVVVGAYRSIVQAMRYLDRKDRKSVV